MFPTISRRTFLGGTAVVGGVVLGGAGTLAFLRGSAPHVEGLRALSDHEFRTLAALARAAFPAAGPFARSADDAQLAAKFDGFLADEPDWNRADLKDALVLLEFGPVVFDRRLRTFSNLPDDERLAHFESWRTSDLLIRRQVATAFMKFMNLVFYDDPAVWPHLSYDGPLIRG